MRAAHVTSTRNTEKLPPKMKGGKSSFYGWLPYEGKSESFLCGSAVSNLGGNLKKIFFERAERGYVIRVERPLGHSPARGREAARASNSPELDETERDGTRRRQVRLEPERLTPPRRRAPTVATGFPRSFMTATHTTEACPARPRLGGRARGAASPRRARVFAVCRRRLGRLRVLEKRPRRAPSSSPR